MLGDLRYAARRLLRSRGATLTSALVIALVIAVLTTVHAFVDGILIRPLPYNEPQHLVRLWEVPEGPTGSARVAVSVGSFVDWRERTRAFTAFGALYRSGRQTLLSGPGGDQRGVVGYMTPGLLPTLGLSPQIGRGFGGREAGDVVLISDGLWRRHFGGSRQVLGATLTIEDRAWTVVGVLPPDHHLLSGVEAWIPATFRPPLGRRQRSARYLDVVARLAPGVDLAVGLADLEGIARQLGQEHVEIHGGWSVAMEPLHQALVGDLRPALLTLLGAVSLLSLLGFFNVAHLLLAQTAERRAEISVRSAIGAGRRHLVRLLLFECLGVAGLGGVAGIVIARVAVSTFARLVPDLEAVAQVSLAWRSVALAGGVSLTGGFLIVLLPVLRWTRFDLSSSLRRAGEVNRAPFGLSRLLVGLQVSLAVTVLIATALLVRSFIALQRVDPGFSPGGVQTVQLRLPVKGYLSSLVDPVDRIVEACRSIPGVRSVGLISTLPLSGDVLRADVTTLAPEGGSGRRPHRWPAHFSSVSGSYFETMGIPLVAGRYLTRDDRFGAPPVAVLGATLARRLWPNADAVGQVIQLDRERGEERRIVGVVGDVRSIALESAAPAELYLPYPQFPVAFMALVLKGVAPSPTSWRAQVVERVSELYPAAQLVEFRSLEAIVTSTLPKPRLVALTMTVLGSLAISLAAVGVYGGVALATRQRWRELGIRLALGDTPRGLLGLLLLDNGRTVVVGLVFGLLLTSGFVRYLDGMLFGVPPFDVATFVAVPSMVVTVGLVAALIAARRPTRLDVVATLRSE